MEGAIYNLNAEQIVGRERRERFSQLAWCGEGCFDSRRRVNSNVRHYWLTTVKRLMFMRILELAGGIVILTLGFWLWLRLFLMDVSTRGRPDSNDIVPF